MTVAMTHDELVEAFTGGLAPAPDRLAPFEGSQRLRPDGRPRPEFRAELRKIPDLRNAGLVVVALAYPFVTVGAAVSIDRPVAWIAAFVVMGAYFLLIFGFIFIIKTANTSNG